MLVLCFIVFLGILLAVSIYIYDNSQFSKITGNSFLSVMTNKKVGFLYKLAQKLKKVNGDNQLLFNIVLPQSEWKIDCIFLHESGIYVINAKYSSGWIYGGDKDIQWAQALENGKMNTFPNPIVENKLKINEVKKAIPEVREDLYRSLIVFNNNCSFKKIELHSEDIDVLKVDELKAYFDNNRTEHALTQNEMTSIYSKIEPYMIKKQPKEKVSAKDAASS